MIFSIMLSSVFAMPPRPQAFAQSDPKAATAYMAASLATGATVGSLAGPPGAVIGTFVAGAISSYQVTKPGWPNN